MDDTKVFAAILLLGAASIAAKLLDLWQWHVNGRPIDEGLPRMRHTD